MTDRAACCGVLVVEDDEGYREALTLSLREDGHDVVGVACAEDGLRYLAGTTGAPKLIFIDVTLPGVDGWLLLALLRADVRLAGTSMVIMSASSARTHRAVPDTPPVRSLCKSSGIGAFLAVAAESCRHR